MLEGAYAGFLPDQRAVNCWHADVAAVSAAKCTPAGWTLWRTPPGNRAHIAAADPMRPCDSVLRTCMRLQAAVAGCCHTLGHPHVAMHGACLATLQLPRKVGCHCCGGVRIWTSLTLSSVPRCNDNALFSPRCTRCLCIDSHVGTNLGWSARPGSVDCCSCDMVDDQAGLMQHCIFDADSCMLRMMAWHGMAWHGHGMIFAR